MDELSELAERAMNAYQNYAGAWIGYEEGESPDRSLMDTAVADLMTVVVELTATLHEELVEKPARKRENAKATHKDIEEIIVSRCTTPQNPVKLLRELIHEGYRDKETRKAYQEVLYMHRIKYADPDLVVKNE